MFLNQRINPCTASTALSLFMQCTVLTVSGHLRIINILYLLCSLFSWSSNESDVYKGLSRVGMQLYVYIYITFLRIESISIVCFPYHSKIYKARSGIQKAPNSCIVHACVCVCSVSQPCLTLCSPMNCTPPGSSLHGIVQARIPECVATYSSRGSSQPRDYTCISHAPALQADSLPLHYLGNPIGAYHCPFATLSVFLLPIS